MEGFDEVKPPSGAPERLLRPTLVGILRCEKMSLRRHTALWSKNAGRTRREPR